METVLTDFEARANEVREYIVFLEKLESPGSALHFGEGRRTQEQIFGTENFSVMKASAFLMIYNLVESSVRSALTKIYSVISNQDKDLSFFRQEYLTLWVQHHFRKLDNDSATKHSFRALSEDLINQLINCDPVDLSSESIPISGNLDARKIRNICESHGISSSAHYRARGGSDLLTVKEKRNFLGHGDVSFVECGRDYTATDLLRIFNQSAIYLRSILRNMKRYIDDAQYAA